MSCIRPFPALRPKPELAERICELPYDVMSTAEARETARDNPHSFLHVSKPEIDLDPSVDLYDPRIYARGRENFQRLIQNGLLIQDNQPCFYLYRQVMGNHSQVGLVATASCEDYEKDIIKKHELTRPDKEDDRMRHIEALNSQTGPVFLIYRASNAVDAFVSEKTGEEPYINFTAPDGVHHTSWSIDKPSHISLLQSEFEKIPNLYIADGHHRSAAAVRIWKARQKIRNPKSLSRIRGDEIRNPILSAYFLVVLFPHNQMQILPYNRAVKNLNGLGMDRFVQRMRELGHFEIRAQPRPSCKHEICIFLDEVWNVFRWRKELIAQENEIGQLDVSLLQKYVLAPLLGIDDPRTSTRISFIGGIRGTDELETHVRGGDSAIAFSMFPTRIEDLIQIADQGGIMPPKSTWFEPKLRDGMFCHLLAT